MSLGEFAVQSFGSSNSALIRLPLKEGLSSAQLSKQVMKLKADDTTVSQQQVEFVSPQAQQGALRKRRALALLLVSIGIVAYLAFRFEVTSLCRRSPPICLTW